MLVLARPILALASAISLALARHIQEQEENMS